MENFILNRIQVSELLLSMSGVSEIRPVRLLQTIYSKDLSEATQEGVRSRMVIPESLPPILHKIIKGRRIKGLSLAEITSLGQMIEYSTLTASTMQNWVKRDFKEYLGSPREGKKYSINQAALLFLIEDLRNALDFESIRKLFRILFLKPELDDDDLIEPAQLLRVYAGLFEKLKKNPDLIHKESEWMEEAGRSLDQLTTLTRKQKEVVQNTLLIAALSVQTCYVQSLARQYFNNLIFLDF
ncbi:DUF1836 domain-containing protein [Paenibacillus sp. sgz500958]|uniref:DUF1836 domain-containing protein n=1 Tax=Paenibacillus sp. sgz500958 TaxID=3242475 RepID=UPI0036D433C3